MEAAGQRARPSPRARVSKSRTPKTYFAVNEKSALVWLFAPIVTIASRFPRMGCQASTMYIPGGMSRIVNVPSLLTIA